MLVKWLYYAVQEITIEYKTTVKFKFKFKFNFQLLS